MRKLIITLVSVCCVATLSAQNIYVLSVGICNYKYIRGLKQTEADAKAMAALYNTPTPHVSLLLGKEATHNNVLAALGKVCSLAKDNDIVVFVFSGHGAKGGLCAYDTKQNNLITYSEVQRVMRTCKAKNKQMYIDACFSGGLRSSSATSARSTFKNSSVMLFLSSRNNETSRENPYGANGVFTTYLLKGMKGGADVNRDRLVTARELFDYVSAKVAKATANKQHPVMWGKFHDELHVLNWNKKTSAH